MNFGDAVARPLARGLLSLSLAWSRWWGEVRMDATPKIEPTDGPAKVLVVADDEPRNVDPIRMVVAPEGPTRTLGRRGPPEDAIRLRPLGRPEHPRRRGWTAWVLRARSSSCLT